MVAFNNETRKTHEPPTWRTLTAVSRSLGIPRDAVRSAARRALKNQEPWVKKGNNTILVDIHHEIYRNHAKRWQEQRDMVCVWEGSTDEDDVFQNDASSTECRLVTAYQWHPTLMLEGSQHWPEFCQWLASQGLHIGFNLLAGEQATSLQWNWDRLQGEVRNGNVKEAIIAALSAKFNDIATMKAEGEAEMDWILASDIQPPYITPEASPAKTFCHTLWRTLLRKEKHTPSS